MGKMTVPIAVPIMVSGICMSFQPQSRAATDPVPRREAMLVMMMKLKLKTPKPRMRGIIRRMT
jgi:hypothetical protein